MKETASALTTPSQTHTTPHWARTATHRIFERLQVGCLEVLETGESYYFGEAPSSASLKATIYLKDPRAYWNLVEQGELGAGEAYMQGLWDSPDLVAVIRVFAANLAVLSSMEATFVKRIAFKLWHFWHRNNESGAKANIAAHYDLSNDFFRLFLDNTMAYSAGLFLHETSTLEQASLAKFRRICECLQLKPSDHLLEIGTGWGGLAIFAAKQYGCRVTTTTISQQQYDYARAWITREGLSQQITLLCQDYRAISGCYDKLVSIEMIEAVGAAYYPQFFQQCNRLLKAEGLMFLQAITISDQRYQQSLGNADFIKRYIFPGGQLPCNAEITRQVAEHTDMQMIDCKDITYDYVRTLRAWRERFHQQLPAVRQLGFDESFIRMWRYYLCFCEGGFLERIIHTAQFVLAKPRYKPSPP